MSEEKIPINEFRAHTAEVLRAVKESGATYVVTSRGEPVADIVPHGTALRRRGKSLRGIYADSYDHGWDNVPLQEQVDWNKRMWGMPLDEWEAGLDALYDKYNPKTE
jgi:prevent-host-death family protein